MSFPNLATPLMDDSKPPSPPDCLEVRINGGLRFIPFAAILFVRAEHVYVCIFLNDGETIVQRNSLRSLLSRFPEQQFLQVHRSYIVNLIWVRGWGRRMLQISDHRIPVSRTQWPAVKKRLEGR